MERASRKRSDELALARLEQLRRVRVAPKPSLAIGGLIEAAVRDAKRQAKGGDAALRAWESLAPTELAGACSVSGCARGVLTIVATSAPARYACEAWLAKGGLAALRTRARTIKSVRVRLGGAGAP